MLDGFFFIESWRIDSERLIVRLVPDHYQAGYSEPVVEVVVDMPEGSDFDTALAKRKDELIVGLQVTDKAVTLYAESDDEKPACFTGGAVSVNRRPYSVTELQRIIDNKDEELSRNFETLRAYRATIDSTTNLVAELVRRAEIKRGATSRDQERYNHEIDVLLRVLHRIQER